VPRHTSNDRRPPIAEMALEDPEEIVGIFSELRNRFGARTWIRRRGARHRTYGVYEGTAQFVNVYNAHPDGSLSLLARGRGEDPTLRAIVVVRPDGSDIVHFAPADPGRPEEEELIHFLLAKDTRETPVRGIPIKEPVRNSIVADYLRRAVELTEDSRNLHYAVETAFNRDLILFFLDQGFSKDEIADHLGISRATLYRLYHRTRIEN
jgi:hypothetical protein